MFKENGTRLQTETSRYLCRQKKKKADKQTGKNIKQKSNKKKNQGKDQKKTYGQTLNRRQSTGGSRKGKNWKKVKIIQRIKTENMWVQAYKWRPEWPITPVINSVNKIYTKINLYSCGCWWGILGIKFSGGQRHQFLGVMVLMMEFCNWTSLLTIG